jgi:hypothetical protein
MTASKVEFREWKSGVRDAGVAGLRLRIFSDGKSGEVAQYDTFSTVDIPDGHSAEDFMIEQGLQFYERRLAEYKAAIGKE